MRRGSGGADNWHTCRLPHRGLVDRTLHPYLHLLRIRQHTSAYASIRHHMSAYVSLHLLCTQTQTHKHKHSQTKKHTRANIFTRSPPFNLSVSIYTHTTHTFCTHNCHSVSVYPFLSLSLSLCRPPYIYGT
jgi:hypothetical protein